MLLAAPPRPLAPFRHARRALRAFSSPPHAKSLPPPPAAASAAPPALRRSLHSPKGRAHEFRDALDASLARRLPQAYGVASFDEYLTTLRRGAAALEGRGGSAHASPREARRGEDAAAAAASELQAGVGSFRLSPREVKAHLDLHVIAQDEAKRALAVAVCDHYNFARRALASAEVAEGCHVKPNVLLLGPSGSGKTHLMRALTRLLRVPFVKADATKFSATGYVGGDVDDVIRSLVSAAAGDVALAEYGIVYIDEVDKLAEPPHRALLGGGGGGVNTRDVQCALLKLMEDAEVPLKEVTPPRTLAPRGEPPRRVVRTRHILFVFSGAFTSLEQSLRQQHAADDVLHLARTADFTRHGLEVEFVGRLPVRVACRALQVDELVRVLTEPKDSVVEQMRSDFLGYDIELSFTPPALRRIAELAHAEGTGARGLLTILEGVLRDFKFELPSTTIRHLEVDVETVSDPASRLEALLRAEGVKPE
ncbi:hypothetical protein AB1Y20_013436 [Prymnesium parvum]|uniref:ATP-dependent Clp protease ATP-binding subunit ClpX n=1 Tax=Prymnesium parvum TaxID=97485 RepID=A0AB34IHQ7_PRYPA